MSERLKALADAGVSIWLDDLSRDRITSGNLADLVSNYSVSGVTTNPTIFATALSKGHGYDEQIKELAARDAELHDTIKALTTDDVRNACDVMAATHAASKGVDGRVSIEVDPDLAHETEATTAQALDLWKIVDRPNVLIKIPATKAGLPSITSVTAEGVSVNVTLIFSLERYKGVIDAYMSGLEQAAANGHDLSQIHSVASFFVSRVDTEIDKRLDASRLRGGEGPEGQGGDRERAVGVRAVRGRVQLRALRPPGVPGSQPAAAAVGVHRRQGPGLPRHHVRHRPGGGQHGEHHAGEDHDGLRRPW